MQRYSVGDLSQDMPKLPGEKANLTETMDATKANLSAIWGLSLSKGLTDLLPTLPPPTVGARVVRGAGR